jgi:hypothetical protein
MEFSYDNMKQIAKLIHQSKYLSTIDLSFNKFPFP